MRQKPLKLVDRYRNAEHEKSSIPQPVIVSSGRPWSVVFRWSVLVSQGCPRHDCPRHDCPRHDCPRHDCPRHDRQQVHTRLKSPSCKPNCARRQQVFRHTRVKLQCCRKKLSFYEADRRWRVKPKHLPKHPWKNRTGPSIFYVVILN